MQTNDDILLCPGNITHSYNKELEVHEERMNQECFSCRRLALPSPTNNPQPTILAWHGHGPCPDKLEGEK